MKTPAGRYQTDVEFKALVDLLESFIHKAKYTPSELREAVILAAIMYEQTRPLEVRIETGGGHEPIPASVRAWLWGEEET